jgi:hypothetical protein
MNEENKSPLDAQRTTMQNVVQEMLPDDLKKKFVLQKNSNGEPMGNIPDPLSPRPASIPATQVKLDPNLVQKPIRTFESDLAEALAKKQGSSASISIAENQKKDDESRKAEIDKAIALQQKQAPVQSQRPTLHPVAPTRATAIPGVSITIPPEVPRDMQSDIVEQIRAAQPAPQIQVQTPQKPQPTQQMVTPKSVPAYAVNVPPVEEEAPRRSILKPLFLILISLILIAGGVFAGLVVYQKSTAEVPLASPTPVAEISVIPHDAQIGVTIASERGNNLISKIYAEINKNSVAPGKNLEVRIFADSKLLKSSDLISRLSLNMPDVIERSLTDRWMLGVYGEENGQKTTFMALTTDFFQNAFAGMLSWEEQNVMANDLALLLNFKEKSQKEELNASSTTSFFGIRGQFSDRTIRNRDVREFRTPNGELLFLYSFVNTQTLLLTTTESSFIALIDRIEKDSHVR